MKIRPVGVELFHADGRTNIQRQTDMIEQIVSLRDSANAPTINVVYFMAMFFVPSTFVG